MTRTVGRHAAGGIGLFLAGIGIAQRLAFYTLTGAALMAVGFGLLAWAACLDASDEGAAKRAYPLLFAVFALVAALTSLSSTALVLLASSALVFGLCGPWPNTRRVRLGLTAGLVILSHAALILHITYPEHQDVYRFLNYGIDALARGHDPYRAAIGADGLVFKFTYPPGALLVLAPFRLLLGDVRWAYVAGEGLVTWLLARLVRRGLQGPLPAWREALILLPLVLPRASQAFYTFTNHEWALLALAALAITFAIARRWILCAVVLALGIAAKQYFIVFPALFLLSVVPAGVILAAVAGAVVITVPFVIWDPPAIFSKALLPVSLAPDPDRVTLWAVLHHAGVELPRPVSTALLAISAAAAAVLAWINRAGLDRALLVCGVALAAFTFLGPFSAYNYYAYAFAFVCWGLLGLPGRQAISPITSESSTRNAVDPSTRPAGLESQA